MKQLIATFAVIAAVLSIATTASAAPVVSGEFPLPFAPNQVAPGPDGNMWVTLQGGNTGVAKITPDGTVTPFNAVAFQNPTGITAGPDGNLWVTQSNEVVRFSPADPVGTATGFAVDIVSPQEIISGPDGNLWTAANDKVFKINTAGVEQQLPVTLMNAKGIAAGTDGLIWVVDFAAKQIVSFTTSGAGATPHPVASGDPQDVVAGLAGQVAYTSPSNEIGRLTSGAAGLPTAVTGDPFGMTFGVDESYWTAQFATNNLGRLTGDGQYTTLEGFAANSGPRRIAAGPNNTLWVTLETSQKIARVSGLETPDAVAPVISRLSVKPAAFRIAKAATPLTAKRAPAGTKIRFTLSEAATVSLRVERIRPGRRSGSKCAAPRKSLRRKRKCNRYAALGTITRQGVAGANSVSFSGRLGSRALRPGSFRVVLTAVDARGNVSTPVSKRFRIVRR